MGIASRNENRPAAFLFRPSINPAVIVMPARDVPGIMANAWNRPITRASRIPRVSRSRSRLPE